MRRTSLLLPLLPALLLAGCADHPLPTAVAPQGAALSAAAGDYMVTTTADSGPGSLREAISLAHAMTGAKTITFAIPGCSASACTIQLASVLQIRKPDGLTIDGAGQRITLSGNHAVRVIENGSLIGGVPAGSVLTLRNLTISNGARSGIHNGGTLTLSHSTVSSNNTAQGGGGIQNFGAATISHSTISGNSASGGGGIYNSLFGTVTVTHSTISNNTSDRGGGIYSSHGTLTVVSHSTIAHNSSLGQFGAAGLDASGTVRITNSMVANNSGVLSSVCTGALEVRGVNFGTGTNCMGITQVTSAELALEPLDDNGGPTLTHALGQGSVALDASDCTDWDGSTAATDQRGVSRPQGSACDVGAFELEQTADYLFHGFFAPVANGVVNVAKAGQTIPLRWRLTDAAGNPITTLSSAQVTFVSQPCDGGSPSSPIGGDSPGASGLQNLGDGNYQFNWKTARNLADRCGTMYLDLGEAGTHTAQFHFTR